MEIWNTASRLRDLARQHSIQPAYLLAYEVAAVQHYLPDLNQRFLIDTLWHTGGRISEVLSLTPDDFMLVPPRCLVALRTAKQRQRGRGRPRKDVPLKRLVPILDDSYLDRLDVFLSTFPCRRNQPLWPVCAQTVRNWLQRAVQRAAVDGVHFTIPVTPHVFRHSYAMHLLLSGHVHIKRLQSYLGHRSVTTTEIYTSVLALDAAASEISLAFDVNPRDNPLLAARRGRGEAGLLC